MKNAKNYSPSRRDLLRVAAAAAGLFATGCGRIQIDKHTEGGEDPDVTPTQPPIPYVSGEGILRLEQMVDNPGLFGVNGGSIPPDEFIATWGFLPSLFLAEGDNGRGQAASFNADTHRLGLLVPRLYAPQNGGVLSLMETAMGGGLPLTFVGKYIGGNPPVVVGGKRTGGTLDVYAVKPLLADPLDDPIAYESTILDGLTPVNRS